MSHHSKIDNFIAEIRSRPEFVIAAASDTRWSDHLDNIDGGLNAIDRKADSDPKTIEIFDKILIVIGRNDLSMKQRLLRLCRLLAQVRDVDGTRH